MAGSCAQISVVVLRFRFFQPRQAGKAGASDVRVRATLEPPAGRLPTPLGCGEQSCPHGELQQEVLRVLLRTQTALRRGFGVAAFSASVLRPDFKGVGNSSCIVSN